MSHFGIKNNLWLKWALNCAFGELSGIAVAGAIAFGVNKVIGEPHTFLMKILVLFCMLIAGAIEGTLLGYFQWRVLIDKFSSIPKGEWLFFTILVAVLGWFLGMLPSLFFIPTNATNSNESNIDFTNPILFAFLSLVTGLFLGAIFGLFQWFSLKKYAHKAYKWILANALGWGFGLGWIYLFASVPTETTTLSFNIIMGVFGGLLAGLSIGALTGIYLIQLEKKNNYS